MINFIKPQTLKGFRDFPPEEAAKRNWLKEKISQVCEQWGFEPLETPTLEPLEIFLGQIGDEEKLFYKFEDQGGRMVALRYDQTVPTCRFVTQYQRIINFPFKRYQIQPAFRSEKPQKGRFREFLQVDADIFGVKSPTADAETIALGMDIFKQLGFNKITTRLNDRNILKGFPYQALVAIDKLKKIGKEGVLNEMEKRGITPNQAREYFNTINTLKPNDTINLIFHYLSDYGFDNNSYIFDPTIVRSFAYSSGPIWEIEINGYDGGSVLGGERYDNITKSTFDVEIPGTGFGLGFDRTLEALIQFGIIPSIRSLPYILITIFTPDFNRLSLNIAKNLRENNINCTVYPDPNTKLDKQIKYADKKGINYCIIIGPDEAKNHQATIKDLKTGKQIALNTDEITAYFKKLPQ